MSQRLITSRDPQGLDAVGLFEAAYNESRLDEARAQRLIKRGGELRDGIAKLIAELTTSNQFADEHCGSVSGFVSLPSRKASLGWLDRLNRWLFKFDPARFTMRRR